MHICFTYRYDFTITKIKINNNKKQRKKMCSSPDLLVPVTMTLLGNSLCKWNQGKIGYTGVGWAGIQCRCPYNKREMRRQRQRHPGEGPCEDGGRITAMLPQTQEHPPLLATASYQERRGRLSPRALRRAPPC